MSPPEKTNKQEPEVLDAATLAALEEGLNMAAVDPQRWTPQHIRKDARAMTKEWRRKITHQANA